MSIYQIAGLIMIVILAVAGAVYVYKDAKNFSDINDSVDADRM